MLLNDILSMKKKGLYYNLTHEQKAKDSKFLSE